MTTTAPAPAASAPAATSPTPTTSALTGRERLTFGHLVRSEWLKLISLRSTWWTLGLTIVGMVGMSSLIAFSFAALAGETGVGELDGLGAQVLTFGFFLGQITVAVLGALVITGEYSTGMIRSTFTAAPGRLAALSAKALVLTVVVFITGIIGGLASWALTIPILPDGTAPSFSDPVAWRTLAGLGVYLTLVALMAFALGVIVRSSAGAIAAVLGILLMLPMAFGILSGLNQSWANTILTYLPSEAGSRLMVVADQGTALMEPTMLTWWQGGLVMLGYVVVFAVIGGALATKRDA